MPRYDRTGPTGLGPRTGLGLGPCGQDVGLIGRPLGRIGRGLFGRWPGRLLGLGLGLGLARRLGRRRFW